MARRPREATLFQDRQRVAGPVLLAYHPTHGGARGPTQVRSSRLTADATTTTHPIVVVIYLRVMVVINMPKTNMTRIMMSGTVMIGHCRYLVLLKNIIWAVIDKIIV